MIEPYYQDQYSAIYCGDCRDIAPQLEAVDLALTDPPYGINYNHSGGGKGVHQRRNLVPVIGDDKPFNPSLLLSFPNVICFGADHYADKLPATGRWLAWDKLDGLLSFDSFSDVEFAWHSKKGASRIFRYLWKGVCQAGEKGLGRVHPTQKPVALMKWCILQAGSDIQTVLDPYMGSGTTLVAAKQLGIRSIGIEISEKYCEIAVKRLAQGVLEFA